MRVAMPSGIKQSVRALLASRMKLKLSIEDYLGPKLHQYVELAPKTVCNDAAHIQRLFQDIVHTGGEGIILRDPSAPYQPGKSRGYLKYKVLILSFLHNLLIVSLFQKFRDAEALVVGSVDSNTWRCEL